MILSRGPRPLVTRPIYHDAQDSLRRLPGGPSDEDGPESHGRACDALKDWLAPGSDAGGGAEARADHAVHEGDVLSRLEFVVDEGHERGLRAAVVVSCAEDDGPSPVDVALRGVCCSDNFYGGSGARGGPFCDELSEGGCCAAIRMARIDDENVSVAVHPFV